jgi:predicted amino acid racemase
MFTEEDYIQAGKLHSEITKLKADIIILEKLNTSWGVQSETSDAVYRTELRLLQQRRFGGFDVESVTITPTEDTLPILSGVSGSVLLAYQNLLTQKETEFSEIGIPEEEVGG